MVTKWVEESVIDFLPGTVAIEGYLQFEHVIFVQNLLFPFPVAIYTA